MDDLASANVNRSYSLAAASLSIFTFMLVFLYPRVSSGEVDTLLFQSALAIMGLATFSFVFASFHYYGSSLGSRIGEAERGRLARRGDRLWLIGYVLLFLAPSLILFASACSRWASSGLACGWPSRWSWAVSSQGSRRRIRADRCPPERRVILVRTGATSA